jgi:hypothetical protein
MMVGFSDAGNSGKMCDNVLIAKFRCKVGGDRLIGVNQMIGWE